MIIIPTPFFSLDDVKHNNDDDSNDDNNDDEADTTIAV